LHALAGALIRDTSILPGARRLLTVAAFPSDPAWEHTPAVLTRPQKVAHFFLLPGPQRQVPKLTLMAEGDLLL